MPETRPGHQRGDTAGPGGWCLRDSRYRLLVGAQVGYSLAMMVLNFALPVYAVTVLGLPGWVTGAVFVINTVLIGLGQGLVVLALTGRLRWRILVLTQVVFAASWVLLLAASAGARRPGDRAGAGGVGRLHRGRAAGRAGAGRARRRGGARRTCAAGTSR